MNLMEISGTRWVSAQQVRHRGECEDDRPGQRGRRRAVRQHRPPIPSLSGLMKPATPGDSAPGGVMANHRKPPAAGGLRRFFGGPLSPFRRADGRYRVGPTGDMGIKRAIDPHGLEPRAS